VLGIGVLLEFPPALLPYAVKALLGSDPGTRTAVCYLSSAAQLDASRDGALDLGLLCSRPPDCDLDAIDVVRNRSVFCCRPRDDPTGRTACAWR
jgi:hypothetical protein